jgi:two-component system chemotaxis response regulator CheB
VSSDRPVVLVCDDSGVDAADLQRLLEHGGKIDVGGISATGDAAVEAAAALRPDLVTMAFAGRDPGGLYAVEEIMSRHPAPILVLLASDDASQGEAALAAGALEVLQKNAVDVQVLTGDAADTLRRRVVTLSRSPVIHHPRAGIERGQGALHQVRKVSVIGFCASAGGPQVLRRLFDALPRAYAIPLLVVQHMAAGFTPNLAEWLRDATGFPVSLAEDGARLGPGASIAPDGAHLKLTSAGTLALDTETVRGVHRPSGDVLFESIATAAGRFGASVILTGMGEDGSAGALEIRRSGGVCVAQDEASSAIFGMPSVARDRGVDLVLSPPEIVLWMRGLQHAPIESAR